MELKNKETIQPLSEEELENASGGFGFPFTAGGWEVVQRTIVCSKCKQSYTFPPHSACPYCGVKYGTRL